MLIICSIICSSCNCYAGSVCLKYVFYIIFVITIMYVIFRLGGVCSHVCKMLYKLIAVNNLPCTSQENWWIDTANRNDLVCHIFQYKKVYCRGEWGYLDRFLFFLRRPFPNYPICEINVLLYFSHFFLSPVFFILF